MESNSTFVIPIDSNGLFDGTRYDSNFYFKFLMILYLLCLGNLFPGVVPAILKNLRITFKIYKKNYTLHS